VAQNALGEGDINAPLIPGQSDNPLPGSPLDQSQNPIQEMNDNCEPVYDTMNQNDKYKEIAQMTNTNDCPQLQISAITTIKVDG